MVIGTYICIWELTYVSYISYVSYDMYDTYHTYHMIHMYHTYINKLELIDNYRTLHPKTTEYTFFSSAHGTFSRIDHILGQKSSLGRYKKIDRKSTRLNSSHT